MRSPIERGSKSGLMRESELELAKCERIYMREYREQVRLAAVAARKSWLANGSRL